jgi:alpha-amylase
VRRFAALGAALLALAALAPVAGAGTTSPADWRDLVIYQVVTDRFANGSTANDAVEGNYAPADGYRIHGGDFAGLTARLDYLVNLGVDAVWIAPVVLNANAEYHGYAARDFLSIAPHFGTLAELRGFVDAAHARGIRVIIDVVCNHMGTLITSSDSGWPAYRYPAGYTLRWANSGKRFAGVFDDLTKFHPYGNIGNYSDPEQVLGQLSGLNDLRTEDATVRAALLQAAQFLIDSTDCDGFRVDTVKHVEMGFWSEWCSAVRLYAATRGKTHFLMFGEVWDGDDAKVGSYTGTMGGGAYKFDSMLHYPLTFTADGVFGYGDAPANLPARYAHLTDYDASTRERLATFLDNHDNSRFLGAGVADQDESRLEAALAWLLTSRGVPIVYYGTEQGFDGGGDPYCREDMWAGQWNFGPSLGDNFDQAHRLFRRVRALLEVRRRHEALRRGATTDLYAESAGPGLYAYRRESATDSALVAVNSANAPLAQAVTTAWSPGTALVDALEPAYADTVGVGGSLTVRLPARGARIYESIAARAATLPPADVLHVESVSPAHDRAVNDRWSPLRVVFDRAVDPARLPAAFSVAPAAPGAWQVAGREARYFPYEPWTAGLTYDWALDTTLAAVDGTRLPARFDARFNTVAYSTGVGVPAGCVADRIARQDLTAPEGILPAPWIGPGVMLVADAGRDRLFELTVGGDLGHFLGDARWGKPEGLAYTAGGDLAVTDPAGLFLADPHRMTTLAVGAAGPTTTGALAAGSGAFLDRLYLCDPANDRVVRTTAGGTAYETFATGIKGGEGLAFGPGGAWGADLYAGDCDLTSLGTSADGPGRVARITSAGVVSTLAQDPALLRACALAFDTGGRFGGDLFAADIVNERVLRITSAGAVSVFATGFANLAGSGCLAFGADGALYVADPGSGESFSKPGGSVAQGQVIRISPAALTADAPPGVAAGLELAPPAPNPARGVVALRFTLPAAGRVRLAIYDVAGRRVAVLVDGSLVAGAHEAEWAGGGERPGLYFARLEAGGLSVTRRVARAR